MIKNKQLFNNKCKAYEVFEKYYKRDLIEITSDDDKKAFLEFLSRHTKFIVKPIDGSGGKGIYIADSSEYDDEQSLFNEIRQKGDVVVEELIEQSEEMKALNSSSINTVRVPTLKLKDGVIVFHPFLRSGRGDSVVDNASSGGILAAVDAETGICTTLGVDEKGNRYIKHPQSNVIYPGFQIPKWHEAVALVKELANVVEGNHYVGWDLALTDNGWIMVEGNPRGQLLDQYATQKGIKQELENYINQM